MISYILGFAFTYLMLCALPEDEKVDTEPFDPWLGYLLLSIIWPITLFAYILSMYKKLK